MTGGRPAARGLAVSTHHPPGGPSHRRSAGLVMGCAGVLCFSGTAPATRVAVPVFGALTLTAARIVIAAVLGTITLTLTGQRSWPGRSQIAGILVMGAGLAVGYPGFLALAVGQVPAYHAAVVIGLVPAATAVVSVIRTGERPRNWFWLGCLAGLGAVVAFAAIQDGGALHPADAWLGAAVLSCAIGYVEGGRVSRQIGATRALCWAMIFLAPLAALALAVSAITRSYPALTLPAWAGLWYAGTASMFAGSIAWYRGLAAGGIARIGQLNLAQPFLAITWSGLLLGEHIPGTALIAAAVVIAAMALCINSRDPATTPHPAPDRPHSDPAAGQPP